MININQKSKTCIHNESHDSLMNKEIAILLEIDKDFKRALEYLKTEKWKALIKNDINILQWLNWLQLYYLANHFITINPWWVCCYFKNFQLNSLEVNYELAKKVSRIDMWWFANYISNFPIFSEELMFDLIINSFSITIESIEQLWIDSIHASYLHYNQFESVCKNFSRFRITNNEYIKIIKNNISSVYPELIIKYDNIF